MDGKTQPRLFPADPFAGFGPSRFRPADEPVVGRRIRGRRPARLKRGVREHAPRAPGVYGMLDAKGRVIYVGKAKSLRCRLLSYFRENSRDPKAGRIIEHTRALVWEQTADEFSALLRELELIQEIGPRFNVLGRPGLQRYHYICVGKTPAPYLYVTKSPTGKERGCYGPLTARPRSEDAVRRLNDWFKLRDCPQTVPLAFADQTELFPQERGAKCLRYEIGTCFGPCVGACTRAEYGAGVRAAKAFLDGRDRTLLATLRERMEAAAGRYEFEKATALRDRLTAVEWLDSWLGLLRQARHQHSFVYPLAGPDGTDRWYLIHRGQVRAAVPAPRTPAARTRTAALIEATFAGPAAPTVLTGGAVDSVLLVGAWFRRHPGEKAKLLTKAAALARCGRDTEERLTTESQRTQRKTKPEGEN
ncbi:MAG: uvrC 1 [Gemmataceae bacterium]|nr:uvrC 1 [Gemmataceae bacterium]